MSWLSQGLSDIGLGGLNTFWQQNKPIIEDIGIGLGAAGLAATGLGAAGIGPLAGMFGAEAGLGGAAAADVGAGAAATTFDAAGTGALAAPASWTSALSGGGLADAGGAIGGLSTVDAAGNPINIPQGLMASATPEQVAAVGGSPPLLGGQGGSIMYGTADPVSPFYDPAVFPDATAAADAGTTAPGTVATGQGAAAGAAAKPSPWSLPGIGSSLTPATSLGAAIGLGGLGYNMYQGYEQKQQLNALQNSINQQSQTAAQTAQQAQAQAQPEMNVGTTLQQPLLTDQLPASAQASIDQAVQQQRAQIISGYAQRGMSADPNQNSALANDLANLDQQALSLKNTLETNYFNAGQQAIQSANQMIAQGLSAASVSAQLPIQMQQLNMQLSSATSTAIASFAKGLTPMSGQQYTLQPAQAA